ncbi:MAG: 50S ribosomal protein L32 [Candidatus Paceibacteria bacterium]
MAVPKRRHTPGRRDKRRSHHRIQLEDKIHGVKHRYKRYYDRMNKQSS